MRRGLAFVAMAALVSQFAVAIADEPAPAGSPQERSVDPVILTGAQFPGWSAGPDPTFREPQPLGAGSDCAGQQQQYGGTGDTSCYQESRLPHNPVQGAPVERLLGYRWNGSEFVQIPFQVDERFTRYLSNTASGFAFYSWTDQHNTFAFDREGFRYSYDDSYENPDGNNCLARPRPGSTIVNGYATTPDPVIGLDDDDELVFMYRDTGEKAPALEYLPDGIESAREIAITDPSNPGVVRFAYVMLASEDGPGPAFDASTGYVRYLRDSNADTFVFSRSSYGGYGAAPVGPVCLPDGSPDPVHPGNVQRRPLDTAWIKTARYAFRYDGRWLMTQLRISPNDTGLQLPGFDGYGPDIIDRWKARAFAQDPSSEVPCCGYEEEDTNWGGSSILMGERWGPVRAIRETWGADSSTNNARREVFYRDLVVWGDALRVHPIPPIDGIYVQWDYNIGAVNRYYNPMIPAGVAIDRQNDEVFGNFDDPCNPRYDPNVGNRSSIDETYRQSYKDAGLCEAPYHLSIDVMDPTFSTPGPGALQWEQVTGPEGTIVSRWSLREITPGGAAQSVFGLPYYRDDSCFDDGTGTDPGPKFNLRSGNEQDTYSVLEDGVIKTYARKCWEPGDPHDPNFVAVPDRPGDDRYFQGSIGTHGLHLLFVAESDNAMTTLPLTEIDSEQRMVILPGGLGNVGEIYGRSIEFPLRATAIPYR